MNTRTDCWVVVEPNELMRRGLTSVISASANSNCAGFDSIETMKKELDADLFDAVMLINFGRDENIVAQDIDHLQSRYPKCQIVVLSDKFSHRQVCNAIRSGASGYLLSDTNCETLVKSLELISMGQPVVPHEAFDLFLNGQANDHTDEHASKLPASLLTDRELAVLRCISRAMSNKLIARECHICEATVKVHVKAILRKINGKNRTEAAIWAMEHGLKPIEPQPRNLQLAENASDEAIDESPIVHDSRR